MKRNPGFNREPFSIFGGEDKIVWKYNPNGEFSVSSAYWTLFNEMQTDDPQAWTPGLWKKTMVS